MARLGIARTNCKTHSRVFLMTPEQECRRVAARNQRQQEHGEIERGRVAIALRVLCEELGVTTDQIARVIWCGGKGQGQTNPQLWRDAADCVYCVLKSFGLSSGYVWDALQPTGERPGKHWRNRVRIARGNPLLRETLQRVERRIADELTAAGYMVIRSGLPTCEDIPVPVLSLDDLIHGGAEAAGCGPLALLAGASPYFRELTMRAAILRECSHDAVAALFNCSRGTVYAITTKPIGTEDIENLSKIQRLAENYAARKERQ